MIFIALSFKATTGSAGISASGPGISVSYGKYAAASKSVIGNCEGSLAYNIEFSP